MRQYRYQYLESLVDGETSLYGPDPQSSILDPLQVGTSIINPEGFNAVGGLYPQKVYDNFPVMLRRLSYIYAVMSAIGALAIEPPPPAGVTDGKTPVKAAEGATVGEALKDKKFWMMWFMVRLFKLGSEDAVHENTASPFVVRVHCGVHRSFTFSVVRSVGSARGWVSHSSRLPIA